MSIFHMHETSRTWPVLFSPKALFFHLLLPTIQMLCLPCCVNMRSNIVKVRLFPGIMIGLIFTHNNAQWQIQTWQKKLGFRWREICEMSTNPQENVMLVIFGL